MAVPASKAWVKPLLSYLKKGEAVFVLVGAGHLGGKGGVLELLKEEGCIVTQLEAAMRAPLPGFKR